MAGKISDDTLQSIRDRLSIVEVVSSYVSLKRTGRNHSGLCPFHSEKSPSFSVNEERGLFHCFGCGAGGSLFNFIMRMENLEFPDAVRFLAQRAGVTIVEPAGRDLGDPRRALMVRVNEYAQRRFERALNSPEGLVAKEYLEHRGLTGESVSKYGIGYCPRGGTGLRAALAGKQDAIAAAEALGLLVSRDDGKSFEKFWGRITLPIRDPTGRIVGFGGRAMKDQQPKYLNSAESSLFHKGNVLYGLHEAKAEIRAAGRIILVEGYLDAISLAEAGIGEVVASLGTALTGAQLRLAKRYAPSIIAFYDGDRAGIQAAVRAFEVCVETGVWASGAFLPDGMDPDDFVRKSGPAVTQELLKRATPLADFYVAQIAPPKGAPFQERVAAADRMSRVLARVHDVTQFSLLARKAAQALDVDESIFRSARAGGSRPAVGVPGSGVEEAARYRPEELMLLEAALSDGDIARSIAARNVAPSFESEELRDLLQKSVAAWDATGSARGIVDDLPASVGERMAAALVSQAEFSISDRQRSIEDCCRLIEARVFDRRKGEIREKLSEAESRGDQAGAMKFAEAYDALMRLARETTPQ